MKEKEKFVPSAGVVRSIVDGFKMLDGSNPAIQTVGEFVASWKNSEVSSHLDEYVKAANNLYAAERGNRQDDVMEACYVGPTYQERSNAAAR